eukprot:TRINITY_DN20552_c0_g1_i1.p1 TRINITY_DN20552_c0_g1~~TRINITY_DN20552_c0_g1_i1.p1  ORF type:complete len:1170 (-),score=194.16 TRINITY_DN20552_c0_g1_i1:552-4061(-)
MRIICWWKLLLGFSTLCRLRLVAAQLPLCRDIYANSADQWRNCRVQIGGLDINGQWQAKIGDPTFGTYLTNVTNESHGLEFEGLALNFNQNFEYVGGNTVDFIYSNPAAYTCMMVEFELTTVASLKNYRKGNSLSRFAGVIFARHNDTRFNSTQDLRDAVISAVSISGLGAMQLQQADLLAKGLNIMTDVKRLHFTGNQGKIVQDVQNGYADVGFVRTDMIDRSVADGKTKWEYFKVMNQVPDSEFPFARSTDFTPEWPIGALKHVPEEIKEIVGRKLMDLDRFSSDPILSEPGEKGSFDTWVTPMNYLGLLGMLESIGYYDPKQRMCLRNADVYKAVNCPSGYVKLAEDKAFCPADECKTGYTCLCEPCAKLKDPELVLSASPIATEWSPVTNVSDLEAQTSFAESCTRMNLCLTVAAGQKVSWSVLDQIGEDARLKINAPLITSVKIRFDIEAEFEDMEVENVTVDGQQLQRYVANVTKTERGTGVVELQVNGEQAAMSPVVMSTFAPPERRVNCPVGQAMSVNTGACEACPPGNSGLGGYDPCRPCNPGSNQSQAGQKLCIPCPVGTVASLQGQVSCDICAAGSSTRGKPGQMECELCDPGSESPAAGAGTCKPCRRGYYSGASGATQCDKCPGGQMTLDIGTTNETQCKCNAGLYARINSGAVSCTQCPEHVYCPFGTLEHDLGFGDSVPIDITNKDVRINSGFFSTASDPASVYRCLDDNDCPGGHLLAGSLNCPGGRTGFLCSSCPDGLTKRSGGCVECGAGDKLGFVFLVLILCTMLPLFLMVARTEPVRKMVNIRDMPSSQMHALFAKSIGGLVLFFVQFLSALSNLQVKWTAPFQNILKAMALGSFSLDVVKFDCLFPSSPAAVFIFKMTCPLLIVIALAGLFFACQQAGLRLTREAFKNAVGQILMTGFITLALAVLVPFQCYEHPNESQSIVSAPSILCWEAADYYSMFVASFFGIVLYLAGFIALVLYALRQYPEAMANENIKFLRTFNFLFFRFHPERFWFGAFLVVRNVGVVGSSMLVPPERADITLLLMQFCMVVSIVGSSWWQPWRAGSVICLIDVILQACLLILISIGSLSSGESGADEMTSWLASILAITCMGVGIGHFSYHCYCLARGHGKEEPVPVTSTPVTQINPDPIMPQPSVLPQAWGSSGAKDLQ